MSDKSKVAAPFRVFDAFNCVILHFDDISKEARTRFISQLVALNSFISYRDAKNNSNK